MDPIKNFAEATLAAGIAADATTATLVTGEGANLATGGAFDVNIWNFTDHGDNIAAAKRAGVVETARVTRSTDTLTFVTRGISPTSAIAHNTSGKTYKVRQVQTKEFFDQLAPKDSPTFTGPVTTSGAVVSAGTAMSGVQINVALRDNLYSATADVTWTHSATPAVGQEYGVIVTTDGTARTITYPVTVFSQARGSDITSSTFPANSTNKVIVRRTASGYTILGDPLTTAQIQALLALTSSAISDFNSATRAQVEAELVAGSNITLTPSGTGATRQITIASSGGGGGSIFNVISGGAPDTNYTGVDTISGGAPDTTY